MMQAADGGMILRAPAQQRSHRRVLTVSAIVAGLLCVAAVCSFGQQVCAVCGSYKLLVSADRRASLAASACCR